MSITTLAFQEYPQEYILSYFYKIFRVLSLSRIFVDFSLKPVYSTSMVEKLSNLWVFRFLGNAFVSQKLEYNHFVHALQSKHWPRFFTSPSPLGGKNYSFHLSSSFSKICFPQQQKERSWRKLWFKIQSENMKILGTVGYLYFIWFVVFSNVRILHFCK